MLTGPVAFALVPEPSDLPTFLAGLTPRALGGGSFSSATPTWWEHDRTFGGFTIAQAIGAAAATVDEAFELHALHGLFLAPLGAEAPLELEVEDMRDGRAFTTRRVTTTSATRRAFEALVSFHRPEDGEEYQQRTAVGTVPGPDEAEPEVGEWPIEVRELGPSPRREDGTYESTRRAWMRLNPATAHQVDAAGQLQALGYLSDMTHAAFRPHSLGSWGEHTDASLDHALWVHRRPDLSRWHLFDLEAIVNHGGRATLRGTLTSEDGQLVASMGQELLIRRL